MGAPPRRRHGQVQLMTHMSDVRSANFVIRPDSPRQGMPSQLPVTRLMLLDGHKDQFVCQYAYREKSS